LRWKPAKKKGQKKALLRKPKKKRNKQGHAEGGGTSDPKKNNPDKGEGMQNSGKEKAPRKKKHSEMQRKRGLKPSSLSPPPQKGGLAGESVLTLWGERIRTHPAKGGKKKKQIRRFPGKKQEKSL